jgi:hypothetical protein
LSYTGPDRRRKPRLAIALPAQLRERGNSGEPVQLVDISVLGCRIETHSQPQPGSWVWLKLPGLDTVYCRVMWSRPAFAGLEFESPLHEAVVEMLTTDGSASPEARISALEALSRRCRFLASRSGEDESDPLLTLALDCEAAAADLSSGSSPG